jgi:hypothetical protein
VPLQASQWWGRQLSWIGSDDAMLGMALFLEQQWFGRLSSIATGRYMVVLENSPNHEANLQWLADQSALNRYLLDAPVRLDDLAPLLGMSVPAWREQFDLHLERLRNRTLAYFLLSTFLKRPDAIDWLDLAPRNGPALQRWSDAERTDRHLQGLVRNWHQHGTIGGLCRSHGVDLGASLEYELLRKFVSRIAQGSMESGQ